MSHLSETINCKSKEFIPCVSHLTPSENAKVIGLVGKKCMVKCLCNDYELDMLWDTGASGINNINSIASATVKRYIH